MDTLRAIVTFIIVAIIVILAIFQMNIRGYEKVGRIGVYVVYRDSDIICEDEIYQDTVIVCANQYIVKEGFGEYSISELLAQGSIAFEDLDEADIQYVPVNN